MARKQNIPNDWDGESWSCYLLEWPVSQEWRAIFNSFIRSLLIGWNWDETSGSIVDAQQVGREIWDRWIDLSGGNDVGCSFSELVQAILDLQGQAGACCSTISGSAGAGGAEAEPEPFEDNGTNYPAGFDDRADYEEWKCGIAQLIIDLWKADLAYLQGTDFLAVTAAFVAAALLTPVPGDEIIALVGLGIALIIEGTLAAVTQAVVDAIENNEEELRCVIYNGVDALTLKGEVEDWFDGKLTALQGTFMGFLVNTDVLNWVFSKVNQVLPDADCSSCTGQFWDVIQGTFAGGSLAGPVFQVAAEEVSPPCGAAWYLQVRSNTDICWQVVVDAPDYITSCLSASGDNVYRNCEDEQSVIDGPDWDNPETICYKGTTGSILMRGGQPFTATFTVAEAEPGECPGGP